MRFAVINDPISLNNIKTKVAGEQLKDYDELILYSIGLIKNLIDKNHIEYCNKEIL